jgi:hypothetical protein
MKHEGWVNTKLLQNTPGTKITLFSPFLSTHHYYIIKKSTSVVFFSNVVWNQTQHEEVEASLSQNHHAQQVSKVE